jgi:glycosyltransferase involved in cell wall biosynthesis
LEILLVDDGSTDGSGDLCDQLAVTDKRICVIHQENQGLSGARNTGIRQATGEYVIFLDSDDEWLLNDGLETLVQSCDISIDLIVFRAVDIWSQGHRTLTKDYDIEKISSLSGAQEVFSHLIHTQQFRASACLLMIRREILTSNEIFFPLGLISEDIYWGMSLWQHVQIVKILNLDLYGYYHRETSISSTVSIRVDRSYDKIFTDWKEHCQHGCVNAPAIRVYMANLWVSRSYHFYEHQKKDKPEVLSILKRHADLLNFANTPKAKRVAMLIHLIGVKLTTTTLGLYWRHRQFIKKNVV